MKLNIEGEEDRLRKARDAQQLATER